jgi:hypothetical protein
VSSQQEISPLLQVLIEDACRTGVNPAVIKQKIHTFLPEVSLTIVADAILSALTLDEPLSNSSVSAIRPDPRLEKPGHCLKHPRHSMCK